MDRFHEQSLAEDEGDVSVVAEIGKPVPAEGGFAGDNKAVPIGGQGEFEFINTVGEFTVNQFAARVVEDAEIKCSGMEFNSSVEYPGTLEKLYRGLLCEVAE